MLTLLMFIIDINARSFYFDTNWGDEDSNDWDTTDAWETSNTLTKPELLDFGRRSAAKPQQANFVMDAFRKFFAVIPRPPIVRPGIYGQERARDENNQTTRPWTARVPIEYLGHWPYNFL